MKKYTDEYILEEAHKYTYLKDFRKEKNSLYVTACSRKLDLGFLKKTINPYTDNLENFVYGYFFTELNYCYIGRTYYLVNRDWEHRNKKNDSVLKFSKKHNVEIPEYVILERGLTIEESSIKEGEWLEKYKSEGWKQINKAKFGSIGGIGKKYPNKDIFEKARQFEYMGDFIEAYPKEYYAASRRKLLKKMTWLKAKNTNIPSWEFAQEGSVYDNKEKCFEMLKGHTLKEAYTIKELEPWYRSANRNGWEEELFGKKKQVKKVPNGFYDDIENIRKTAAKYKTRTEFLKGNPTAYHKSTKELLDELFPLEKPRHPRNSLTKEKCLEIFEFCGFSKVRLQEYDSSVYRKMLENGWLEKEQYMTVDEAFEIAKGCKTKKELREKSNKAYECLRRANKLNDIEFSDGKRQRSYYTYDVCKEIAMTCENKTEFIQKHRLQYDISKDNNWVDDFFPKAA